MRRAIAVPESRALNSICAACARKTLGPSIASRAALVTTASPTHSEIFSSQRPTVRKAPRRWISYSSAQSSPQPSTTKEEEPQNSKSTAHAPLPYYALFPRTLPAGAPPTAPFSIDTRALHREFLQLQAASHPDFHHHAASGDSGGGEASLSSPSSLARRKAEAVSSHINAAYTTLANPLLRAQYILAARHGRDLAGDEASALSGPPDPELLMAVLEARESIEEAASEAELEGVRAENGARVEACLVAVERAFATEDVEAAVRETVRLRYWMNISESVKNWEAGKPVVLQH